MVAEIGGWACPNCRSSLITSTKSTVSKNNKATNASIEVIHKEINSIKTQLEIISDSVLALHKSGQADTARNKMSAPGPFTYAEIASGTSIASKSVHVDQPRLDSSPNGINLDTNLRSQILLAVQSEQDLKNKRSSSIVLTGLPFFSADVDRRTFIDICDKEFSFSPKIRSSSRLGKQVEGKTQPLLITLESKQDADYIIQHAKSLRHSSSNTIRQNVYINKYMTRTEYLAAYKARKERQATKAHIAVKTSDNLIEIDASSNHNGSTDVIANGNTSSNHPSISVMPTPSTSGFSNVQPDIPSFSTSITNTSTSDTKQPGST